MTDKQNIMKHIPNALTVGRLIMTVILLGLILYAPKTGQEKPANLLLGVWILFIVTGLTDIADGYLARKFEVTSKFGRTMDPLADKFLICGAYFCFAWVGQPLMKCFAFSYGHYYPRPRGGGPNSAAHRRKPRRAIRRHLVRQAENVFAVVRCRYGYLRLGLCRTPLGRLVHPHHLRPHGLRNRPERHPIPDAKNQVIDH
ncbi:MAG: CDP-alcohol phosphatidyltransferase family protein [Planctomycetota bacterium]